MPTKDLKSNEETEESMKFNELYYIYKSLMYNNALKILKNKALAEEAVHDAFMSIYRNIDKLFDVDSVGTRNYIIIITRNAAYKIKKKCIEVVDDDSFIYNIPDQQNVVDIVEKKDIRGRIFHIIKKMDSKYSDVFLLKFYYKQSNSEIARIMGITENTLRVRIYRGRKMLKEMLKEEDIIE